MFQRFILFPLLSLFIFTNVVADEFGWMRYLPLNHMMKDVSVFSGDDHGEFANDYVAILDDGSAWKVHPDDTKKFSRWSVEEGLQVCYRTSHFWFKREHKFELKNHNRNESVRAMLVNYPIYPYMIVDSHIYVSSQTLHSYKTTDGFGNVTYHYYWVYEYEKKLFLNDGSIWMIDTKFDDFIVGSKVYLSANNVKGGVKFFLISGIQREATYINANWCEHWK